MSDHPSEGGSFHTAYPLSANRRIMSRNANVALCSIYLSTLGETVGKSPITRRAGEGFPEEVTEKLFWEEVEEEGGSFQAAGTL